jgi:hypothetical protein
MPFGWDKSGRRHLGSFVVPLQPTGEATHHAQAMRPRIVVRIAERGFPAQEQIDRDVIGPLTIGEGGEDAQDAFFEG